MVTWGILDSLQGTIDKRPLGVFIAAWSHGGRRGGWCVTGIRFVLALCVCVVNMSP